MNIEKPFLPGIALVALCGYCISTTIQVRQLQARVIGLERHQPGLSLPANLPPELVMLGGLPGLQQLQAEVAALHLSIRSVELELKHPRARFLSQDESH